jgi:hypothetical protein
VITAALALVMLQASIPPLAAGPTVGELRTMCDAGLGGDAASRNRCYDAVLAQARLVEAKADDEGSQTCMSHAFVSVGDVVWTYLDWIRLNPQDDAADSAPAIMSAMLEKYPCGWEER